MLETIKNIDPSKISDVQGLRAALTVLINAVEQLLQEKEEMKKEIQRLRDENNKLKGGTVRPVTKNPAKRDISSKGRERGNGEEAHEDKNLASSPIEIDSRLTCLVSPKARLPAESSEKGTSLYTHGQIGVHNSEMPSSPLLKRPPKADGRLCLPLH